jgi:polysaccharide export outer membrane protein
MLVRLVRCLPPALLLGLMLSGCTLPYGSHPSAPLPPEPGEMERDSYVIGHGDILRIVVWKNPELSVEAVPVRPDGKISVPLLNDVQASGLTPDELKELLTRSFAEYVQNPDVTVVVTQILSKRVHILGAVARSGAVPLTQDMRVLDAIAAAGGFGPFADKDDIKILRRSEGGGIVEYHFDYDAFMRGRGAEGNMLLAPGDTIVVPE